MLQNHNNNNEEEEEEEEQPNDPKTLRKCRLSYRAPSTLVDYSTTS
jgi:hypothetical protein